MFKPSKIFNDDTSQIICNYFSQVNQCDKVTKALDSYIKTLRLMKESYHRLNSSILALSPKGWHQKKQMKICLEDQGEVLSVAEGMVRSLFPRLKSHSRMISETQTLFTDLESKLQEYKSMHEEFERMKIQDSFTRQQEEQIRFMLRDTNRALEIISGSVTERIYKMDEGTNNLIKDILMKFQEAQKIIATENLEIIGVMSSLISTLPKPKARLKNLEDSQFKKIIDAFKENHGQIKTEIGKAAEQKAIKKHFIEEEPTKRKDIGKDRTIQITVSSNRRKEDFTEASTSHQSTSHQDPAVAQHPNEQPTSSKVHNFDTETEYGEGGRRVRSEKKPFKKAFYGYKSAL